MGVYLTEQGKSKIKKYIVEIKKLKNSVKHFEQFEPTTEQSVIEYINKYGDDDGTLTIHEYPNKSLILIQCEDYRYKFDSCDKCKYIKYCISCKACDNYWRYRGKILKESKGE